MRSCLVLIVACAFAAVLAPRDAAATIVAPIGGEATSSSIRTPISLTFDQSGLNNPYTPGEDFDSYIAENPTHAHGPTGTPPVNNEWLTQNLVATVTVTYDFGSIKRIDAIALWNEETFGATSIDFSSSADGSNFVSIASGVTPTDNPEDQRYGADVFYFAATNMQYFRMELSCPTIFYGVNLSATGCGIGEVAFREASQVSAVPLPAALPLFLTALAWLGLAGWRRTRATS